MPKKRIHIKSVFNFLFSKVVIVALLILIQLAILLVSVILLADYFATIYAVLMVLSICITIWLVNKDQNPSYKLAWVILILAFPVFGGLFYLLFGNKGMPKKLVNRIYGAREYSKKHHCPPTTCVEQLKQELPQYAPMANFLMHTTGAPLWRNTQTEYFPLGENMWESMVVELAKAQKFIFMEYFILEEGKMWDPIFRILKEKAAQGVDVRFMYDDIGSIQTLSHRYPATLRAAGIKCVPFNPFKPHLNSLMNYRDHRKITVIDGNVGYCGGINIADEYINAYEKYGHWKDTGVLLRGEGVWNLTALFLSLWNFSRPTDTDFTRYSPGVPCKSDGFVQAFGDSPLDRINVAEEVYMQIISRATQYVYITTPYLILDNEMITVLSAAARSGVDVRIITPRIPDKWFIHETTRSFYQILLNAGVHIYEYKPGFIHAKMFVSDDSVAVVGTANMDYRSFYLHFECGVAFYQSSIVHKVKADILSTLEQCWKVPHNYQKQVPLWRRIIRSLLRLFSPMM